MAVTWFFVGTCTYRAPFTVSDTKGFSSNVDILLLYNLLEEIIIYSVCRIIINDLAY